MGKSRSRRAKPEEPLLDRLTRIILPAGQGRRGYEVADVANHSDAEQRHAVRSEETRTLRKLTRIDKLLRAGIIEKHHAAACEWYANAHGLGYDTLGITANYGEGVGGGSTGVGHMARNKAQYEARKDYDFARKSLPPELVGAFEAVVLKGGTLSNDATGREAINRRLRFVLCADVLHGRIAHLLPVMR